MTTLTDDVPSLKPRLKSGAMVVHRGLSTYVGAGARGVEIQSPARKALSHMDGARSCGELSQDLGLPLDDIVNLVCELDSANLIDTSISKISVHTRFHSPNVNRASHASDDSQDGAFQQLQSRIAPELPFTTWLPGVRDGGALLISQRRDVSIGIAGDSRIATLLYGILLASGLAHTKVPEPGSKRVITETDLCAGFLNAGDIGLIMSRRLEDGRGELSLFPATKNSETKQTIMVGIGQVPADQIQQWMSQGIPHLLVDSPDGASITVGPFVIPGNTACARCVSMSMEDQNSTWREIAMQKITSVASEVPAAVAHHVAGLVALEVLRFVDEGLSQFLGSCARINFHNPTRIEQLVFTRHPACGCDW